MTSHKATLRKRALMAYTILVCAVIFLHFVFKVPWEQNIRILLGYYEEISLCFGIVSCVLIPFRLLTLKQKGVAPETRRVRLFGPFIDLFLDPLFDVSLFYSALFVLNTIFQERAHGLSLDPFLILLFVAATLLYQSIKDIYEMVREIFYVQTAERVISE